MISEEELAALERLMVEICSGYPIDADESILFMRYFEQAVLRKDYLQIHKAIMGARQYQGTAHFNKNIH